MANLILHEFNKLNRYQISVSEIFDKFWIYSINHTHTHSMSYTRSSTLLELFSCPTTTTATSTTSSAPQNVTRKIVSWLIQPINFNPLSIRCMFCGSVCGLVVHGWWTDSMRYNSPNIKTPALVTITIAITWAMSSVGWQKPTFTRYGVRSTMSYILTLYIPRL